MDEVAELVMFTLERTSPTQDAYDAACRALAHYRALADEATAALMRSSLNVDEAEQLRRRFETPLRSVRVSDA